MFTCLVSIGVTTNGASPINGTQSETGSAVTAIDVNLAANTDNQVVSVSFATAALQLVELVSDQPATVTTNGTDEVQSLAITGSPTGGTFTITYSGQTTSAIAYNAAASAVQTALQALSNVGANNVTCSGGPLPGTPVVCTFGGALANTNLVLMTTTDSLTGGSTPASAITTTTEGVAPSDTFNLKAGMPLVWGVSAGYFANPFSADVVRLNVSCTAAARLQGKVLTN